MKVNASLVKHVYSGIDGRCCCGCAGKHTYSKASALAEKMISGNAPTFINDRTVAAVIKKIETSENPDADFDDGSCVGTVIGKRVYIAYYDH